MPALFAKIKSRFTLVNHEGFDPVVPDFNNLTDIQVNFSIYDPESTSVTFRLKSSELESGSINGVVVGDGVEVEVDAISKINVKADFVDAFLDPATKWEFSGIEGVAGDVEGLEEESYEEYNRFQDKTYIFKRYYIPVKTSKKAKDLA